METSKIKIKIGQHEFEAEGPTELVKSQFETFKQLISDFPPQIVSPLPAEIQQNQVNKEQKLDPTHVPLEKIMRVEGRVVSLTATASTPEDAALLIILGQRDLRNNQSATGQEIGDGLMQSGQPAGRVDRIMDKAIKDAMIMKIGMGRSTRYRLTNQGQTKALNVARDLIAQIP